MKQLKAGLQSSQHTKFCLVFVYCVQVRWTRRRQRQVCRAVSTQYCVYIWCSGQTDVKKLKAALQSS